MVVERIVGGGGMTTVIVGAFSFGQTHGGDVPSPSPALLHQYNNMLANK